MKLLALGTFQQWIYYPGTHGIQAHTLKANGPDYQIKTQPAICEEVSLN